MTTNEWMTQVNEHAESLRYLLSQWHPLSKALRVPMVRPVEVAGKTIALEEPFVITAPVAQRACNAVCYDVVKEDAGDPIDRFNVAIAMQDIDTLMCLLNEAWFGVPESTSCWRIRGFKEAVELLEDPPEDEHDPNN